MTLHARDITNWYRNRLTLFIYWGIRIALVGAIFYLLWERDVASAGSTFLILLLLLVPSFLKERYRLYLPFALDLSIAIFVFLTLFLGALARFYDRVPFWDKMLHFQSGLILGATGYVLIYVLNEHKRWRLNLSPGFISIFAVAFSLSIGAVWEMVEFMLDSIQGGMYWQDSNTDTMWDLIADLTGALIVSIPGYFWMYRHRRLPFTPWVLHIIDQAKQKMDRK